MNSSMVRDLRDRVEATIREDIAPVLSLDVGDIQVLDVVDGVARIRVGGSCTSCPATTMTLIFGIERDLQKHFPEIEYIEAVP